MTRREAAAWAGLALAALTLRLVALTARPPHHDEAVHAHFADLLARQGIYEYDPTYHGPLLFYVTAGVFKVLGENLFTLRLYPALAGTALVLLPFALRRRIGTRAAWWSGAVLAVSPSFLYYSRFARNDVPVALFTAAAMALVLLVPRRGWRLIPWIGVAAALHAISKETFYVLLPLLAAGAAAVAAHEGVGRSFREVRGWLRAHAAPVTTGVLWFVAITVTAYTFVFIHPGDAFFPVKAIRYWYEQHHIQRVGGPWYYHLPRLGLYEFLILGAAAAWVAGRRRRLHRWEVFCLGWGVSGIAMYAYLGEKVPWLEVHQVLPFVPLAGAQLARTWSVQGAWWSRSLAALAVAGTLWSAGAVTYLYPTITPGDPHAELLVFVQTTPAEEALAKHGEALAGEGEVPTGAGAPQWLASVSGEATWPLSWQWRDLKVWWAPPKEGQQPELVVCDPTEEGTIRAGLGPWYRSRTIPLRGWWVERWKGTPVPAVAAWFLTRRAWSPLGATEVVVLEDSRPGRGSGGGGRGDRGALGRRAGVQRGGQPSRAGAPAARGPGGAPAVLGGRLRGRRLGRPLVGGDP